MCGQLLAVVVPSLPRAASIEWHVMAVVDEQQQRQKFELIRSLENYQIKCEAVQSCTARTAAIVISLNLNSPSATTINLDTALHDIVEVFKQAVEKLSEDHNTTPLGFRTFYRNSMVEMESLRTGKVLFLVS